MYAIFEHGGHQYRVTSGDNVLVDRIAAEVGATVTLERVLLLGDGEASRSDADSVSPARVTATVVAHRRGRKLRVFTYKPKKRRRRTLGYRSQLTELRIEEILSDAERPAKRQSTRAASSRGASRRAAPRKADHPEEDQASDGA